MHAYNLKCKDTKKIKMPQNNFQHDAEKMFLEICRVRYKLLFKDIEKIIFRYPWPAEVFQPTVVMQIVKINVTN